MKHQILLVIFYLTLTTGYKILYLLPLSSKSHRNVFDPVIHELARRKHTVTVVSPHSAPKYENIDEIKIENALQDKSQVTKLILDGYSVPTPLKLFGLKYMSVPACELYLQNVQVQQLLKRGKRFDVVIVDGILNDCALATAPLMGNHLIVHSPSFTPSWTWHFIPQPPSFIPFNELPYTSEMTFFQRLNSAITWLAVHLVIDYDYRPAIQSVIAKHIPENPLITDADNRVSLTLVNSDPIITCPRPSIPTVVRVGGVHVKKGKEVPKEFEDFIETSGDDGFILLSLGSNLQSKDIPREMKDEILKGLSRLKQKVIWKYEEKFENLPANILVSKWLPQQDILAHPKIKVFITHGGMLSLQESLYHAVPVVAIPCFAEQPLNVARVEEMGIGLKLDLKNISAHSLSDVVNRILNDESYARNAKKCSAIFHQHVKGQLEKAADWIEYVIKFDGAPHLKSDGEKLNFFQYFLIDIATFIFALLSLIGFILYKIQIILCNRKGNKIHSSY